VSYNSFRGRALARLAMFCLGTSALTAVLLGSAWFPASAATTDWTGGTGDWFTGGNWSAGVPGAGDTAVIGNGGTAQIASTATADTVNVANGSVVTLLSGGALNATNTYVGSSGGVLSSGTLVISSASALGTTTFNLNGTLRATTTATTASNIIFNAGTDSTVSAAAGTTLNLTGNLSFNTSASDGHTIYIGSATDTGTVAISSTTVTVGANAGALEIAGGTLKDISTTTPQSAFATALGNLKSVTIDSGATLEIDSNGNGRGPANETYIKLFGSGQLVMGGSDVPRVVLGNSNFAGQISGAGYIGIGGVTNSTMPSRVILTANNNSAVEFQIASGSVLQIGNGGTSGSLASTAHIVGYSYPSSSGNAVLEFDRSDNVTLGSGLNGSLVLQQSGTGILTVSGNNSFYPPGDFYGSVVVSSGGLSISSDNNLNGNPIALYNGTTLYTTASGTYTSPVRVAGDPTFNVAAGTTTTWSGQITDGVSPGDVQVTGGGTLILTGANSYTGGTSVSGGRLQLAGSGTLGAASGSLTVSNGGTLDLGTTTQTQNGGVTVVNATVQGNALSSSGTFNFQGATIETVLEGTGPMLVSNGTTTLSDFTPYSGLVGANVGSGVITIASSGGLALVAGSSISNAAGVVDNGVLNLSAVPGGSLIKTLSGNGSVMLGAYNLTLTNASGTFSGVITGSGGFTIVGGAEVFSGANTYSGGTTIAGGTLQVGDGVTAGVLPGNVVDNGSLVWALPAKSNDVSAMTGTISGSGSVIWAGSNQPGAFAESLTGANTYTGGTFVNSGILQITGAGTLGSSAGATTIAGGTLQIATNAPLTQNGGVTLISGNLYAGTLSSSGVFSLQSGMVTTILAGAGSVNKTTSGTVTLSAANSYTGPTTVNAGALNVTGSIASSSVSVAGGAILTGTGKVGTTNVASGGTLTPGTSAAPATLTIAGNLTLAAGSNFADAISSGAAGLASVSGTASINGNALANFASGSYASGQKYTLITAAGGISGTFASLATTGLPGNLRGSLSYDANDVYLSLHPNALAPSLASNTTTNQHNVVAAIDAAVMAGATPTGGFNALYNLSGPALNSAIDQISGQIGPNVINAVGQNFLSFLAMTAEGGAGDRGSYAPGSAYGAAAAPHRAQLDGGETRVWGAGFGGHVGLSADAASGAAALSDGNAGLIGGADMQLADHLLAGVTLGWGREHFNSGNGSGTSTDYALGLYGRVDLDKAYVTAAFGYSWHQIATLRVITVSGTDVLQGKQNADDYGGRIEAGWRMALDDAYTIAPFAAFAGESFASPAYGETALSGSSSYALSYAAHTGTLGRSELGAHLDRSYEIGNGGLTADIKAAWAHQLDDQPFTQASFANLPTAGFQVLGVRSTRDAALLGADLELQYASGLFLGVKGEGQFGAGTTIVEGLGSVGLRW
jgi:autotransporter-associated beta strand protein